MMLPGFAFSAKSYKVMLQSALKLLPETGIKKTGW
jgi:hypothetical protein